MSWYNLGQYVMDAVHLTHDLSGFSYAASIVIVTSVGRAALFPLAVLSRRNASLRDAMKPELQRIQQQHSKRKSRDAKRRALAELHRRHGFVPAYTFILPLASLSSTMFMWYGLRWMGHYYPEDMVTGGALWFVDLTEPDPLHFLPIVSASSFVLMGELGADNLGRPTGEYASATQRWFWRGIRLCFFPILMGVPAAVQCFWIPNSILSIVQTVVLSQPTVMKRLGIWHEATKTVEPIVYLKDLEKKNGEGQKSSRKDALRRGGLKRSNKPKKTRRK